MSAREPEKERMKDSLVSVIIPVYNVEMYLRRCVDSVINQTYTNLEIILVDDGSPDLCPQICDEYLKTDSRIKVIHQKNQGLSAARNAGTAISKGAYLMYVDSDDFISRKMVESLLQAVSKENADLSFCECVEFYSGMSVPEYEDSSENIDIMDNYKALDYLLKFPYARTAWGKLYHRRLIPLLNYPKGKYAEDMFVIHKVFGNANKIVLLKKQLYFYNQEGNSLTRSVFNYKKLDYMDAAKEWLEFIKIRYPNLEKNAFAFYISSMINICTHLVADSQQLSKQYFNIYKKIIRKNIVVIMKLHPKYNRDKIKAAMITCNLYPMYVKHIRNHKNTEESNV